MDVGEEIALVGNDSTITSTGWLLQGLGEIGLQVQDMRKVVEDNLTLRK